MKTTDEDMTEIERAGEGVLKAGGTSVRLGGGWWLVPEAPMAIGGLRYGKTSAVNRLRGEDRL